MQHELIPTKDPGIIEETREIISEMWHEIKQIMKKEGNYLAKGMVISFFGMLFVMICILFYASKQVVTLKQKQQDEQHEKSKKE
jgi:hypothetical protein